jgi:hypothetical protein
MRILPLLAAFCLLSTTGCKDLVKSDTVASATVISVKPNKLVLQSKEEVFFVSLEGDKDLRKAIKKGDRVQLLTHNGQLNDIILENGNLLSMI